MNRGGRGERGAMSYSFIAVFRDTENENGRGGFRCFVNPDAELK